MCTKDIDDRAIYACRVGIGGFRRAGPGHPARAAMHWPSEVYRENYGDGGDGKAAAHWRALAEHIFRITGYD